MAEEAKTPAKNNQKEFMEKEPVGKILFINVYGCAYISGNTYF